MYNQNKINLMELSKQPRKLKPRYFEKSLRFPVAFLFLFIFILILAENIFSNQIFWEIQPITWVIMGSGFLVLILLEIIESLVFPKKTFFLLKILYTGIRIIAVFFIAISDPTGLTSNPGWVFIVYDVYLFWRSASFTNFINLSLQFLSGYRFSPSC